MSMIEYANEFGKYYAIEREIYKLIITGKTYNEAYEIVKLKELKRNKLQIRSQLNPNSTSFYPHYQS